MSLFYRLRGRALDVHSLDDGRCPEVVGVVNDADSTMECVDRIGSRTIRMKLADSRFVLVSSCFDAAEGFVRAWIHSAAP